MLILYCITRYNRALKPILSTWLNNTILAIAEAQHMVGRVVETGVDYTRAMQGGNQYIAIGPFLPSKRVRVPHSIAH